MCSYVVSRTIRTDTYPNQIVFCKKNTNKNRIKKTKQTCHVRYALKFRTNNTLILRLNVFQFITLILLINDIRSTSIAKKPSLYGSKGDMTCREGTFCAQNCMLSTICFLFCFILMLLVTCQIKRFPLLRFSDVNILIRIRNELQQLIYKIAYVNVY